MELIAAEHVSEPLEAGSHFGAHIGKRHDERAKGTPYRPQERRVGCACHLGSTIPYPRHCAVTEGIHRSLQRFNLYRGLKFHDPFYKLSLIHI